MCKVKKVMKSSKLIYRFQTVKNKYRLFGRVFPDLNVLGLKLRWLD